MAVNDIDYKVTKPDPLLFHVVESLWMLSNLSNEEKRVIILPDGRFDIFFSYSSIEPYHITISGLDNEASHASIAPKTVTFAISFKLLACEFILDTTIAPLLNRASYLPIDFWGITVHELNDFDSFCKKVSTKMISLLTKTIDIRKQKLFELVHTSNGSLSVTEISENIGWSSRQINRYFTDWVGLSLKTYSNILRYRASFKDIYEGKLFPDQNFSDQAHFIKDVKKYSGVTPKELTKNKDDRFIQFSILSKK